MCCSDLICDFNSCSSRDFPTPGMPERDMTWPSPSFTFCHLSSIRLRSLDRPISGVSEPACAASNRLPAVFGAGDPLTMGGCGIAFELTKAPVLEIEGRGHESPRRSGNNHGVGGGDTLQARGDIRRPSYRVYHPFAAVLDVADDHRAGRNSDPAAQHNRSGNSRYPGNDIEGRMNGARGIVLVRFENRHRA